MKPYLICHMVSSVDGRTLPSRFRPRGLDASPAYERLHGELKGDAWIIGRVTGQDFAKADAYPAADGASFPRDPFIARPHAGSWAVVVDAHGKIAWGRGDIDGDALVVLLTDAVSDAHLAGLRSDGVSYIFAGESELDLGLALDRLNAELGIKRLLLEGGGGINGAFLRAGLVDELSLLVCPVVDGAGDAPAVFDAPPGIDERPPVSAMRRIGCEPLDDGVVWLRYRIGDAA